MTRPFALFSCVILAWLLPTATIAQGNKPAQDKPGKHVLVEDRQARVPIKTPLGTLLLASMKALHSTDIANSDGK